MALASADYPEIRSSVVIFAFGPGRLNIGLSKPSWRRKQVKAQLAKKGLCFFSCATVVSGPWPGAITVSRGRVRIFFTSF